MKNLTAVIATMCALSATGCFKEPYIQLQEPYTQLQLAYAKSSSFQEAGKINQEAGKINLLCARIREGAKTRGGEEVRLGTDLCYGNMPPTTSKREYTFYFNQYISKEVQVEGTSERWAVMVSLPLEYKLSVAKANLPTSLPSKIGLRVHGVKDVDLSFWYALGYNLNITPKNTDYTTTIGTFDNIPGMDVNGSAYAEITQELVLFGKFPIGTSFRADTNGKVTPFISAGGRVQW